MFIDKIERIGEYFAELTSHKRSLQGVELPSKETIAKFEFDDMNMVLLNTLETSQNQVLTKLRIIKEDIISIVDEAIKNGNKN